MSATSTTMATKSLTVREYRPNTSLQAKTISDEKWEDRKQLIRNLYITKEESAKTVLNIVSDPETDFVPTLVLTAASSYMAS